MAGHTAIADVTRSLARLLRSHMVSGADVTVGPPDVALAVAGTRVNLYLFQVSENGALANVPRPPGLPRVRPPLALDLRYLLTAHPEREDQIDAQEQAERALGDAMSVLHHYGPRIDTEAIRNPLAGPPGNQILEQSLTGEVERIKVTLDDAGLEDFTKVWSALSNANMRLSVIYVVRMVQIAVDEPQGYPAPVEERVLHLLPMVRPEISSAHLAVPAGQPFGERRLRIGETLEIRTDGLPTGRVYVRLGDLDPIGVEPELSGTVQIALPDADYPADFDNPLPRPIPPRDRLRAGAVPVRLEVEMQADTVTGSDGPGVSGQAPRQQDSNTAVIQVVPDVAALAPGSGDATGVLQITGDRLWQSGRRALVIVGPAAVEVRRPGAADPWAEPDATAVEVPLAPLAEQLPAPPAGGAAYPIYVEVDGARSRAPAPTFTLLP